MWTEQEPVPRLGWGWYLAAGIAWVFIGLAILTVQPGTIALIGFMVGGVLLLGGAFELAMAFAGPGWRWLHGVAGCALHPRRASWRSSSRSRPSSACPSSSAGTWCIMGTVVLIGSIATRVPGSLWGLGVTVGILEILIGLWAIGYPSRSAWLLILWIGIGAIFHGIADIVTAFHVRSIQRTVQA